MTSESPSEFGIMNLVRLVISCNVPLRDSGQMREGDT